MNPRNKFTQRGLEKNVSLQLYRLRVAGECAARVWENCASERDVIKRVMELMKNRGSSFYNSNHGSTAFELLQNDTFVRDIWNC